MLLAAVVLLLVLLLVARVAAAPVLPLAVLLTRRLLLELALLPSRAARCLRVRLLLGRRVLVAGHRVFGVRLVRLALLLRLALRTLLAFLFVFLLKYSGFRSN